MFKKFNNYGFIIIFLKELLSLIFLLLGFIYFGFLLNIVVELKIWKNKGNNNYKNDYSFFLSIILRFN